MRTLQLVLYLAVGAAASPLSSGCAPTTGSALECPEGLGDCDRDPVNGCETDLRTLANCGECGSVCAGVNGVASCSETGACQLACDGDFSDCDGDPGNGCEASLDSLQHCGGCFNSCFIADNGATDCVQGTCEIECSTGWGDCNFDHADGCESDLLTDQMCGACDHGCTSTCSAGTCTTCDAALLLDSTDPLDAARAMGICSEVVSASWVLPDGSLLPSADELPEEVDIAIGWGLLDSFGQSTSPRAGSRMLALSSGAARQPTDPDYQSPSGYNKGYTSMHPEGFPKESPSCPNSTTGEPHDGVGLELELQVPEWANGIAFDFSFYTWEWPTFICSSYNDFFVAILDPIPEGQTDGNISFDQLGNPVSVNNAFLSSCGCVSGPPCMAGGKAFDCAAGTDPLMETGFEGHAATDWLTTRAPVEPSTTIKLRFAVYDSGDGSLDSTALIDNFRWMAIPPEVSTNPIE